MPALKVLVLVQLFVADVGFLIFQTSLQDAFFGTDTRICSFTAAKALEMFLQNLCDKTYEITLRRGAKTMSSIHL